MAYLDEILDVERLDAHIVNGYVRRQFHNELPYAILTYTHKAQYDGLWDSVTTVTRGLIYDTMSLEIVARPFKKFFNYTEPYAPELTADRQVFAFDKLDGYLGIVYPHPDTRSGWAVASRGSFHSEYAEWATEWFNGSGYDIANANPGWTTLVEIIYPDKPIVLEYDYEGLVYLGEVNIDTGDTVYDPDNWRGKASDVILAGTVEEALELPPRPKAEGLVLWDPLADVRVKVKYDDYLHLHRLLWDLTDKRLIELLREGRLGELTQQIPEGKNLERIRQRTQDVLDTLDYVTAEAVAAYSVIQRMYGDRPRKEIALAMRNYPKWLQSYVFSVLDNRDTSDILWRKVEELMKE